MISYGTEHPDTEQWVDRDGTVHTPHLTVVDDPYADVPPPDETDDGWTVEELAELGRAQGTPTSDTAQADRFPRLDWREAFATDFSQIDFLPGKFLERGQQVALVGDGKVGKSLFAHDWLWRCVTGRSFLGDDRRDPLRVLYFDRENGLRDIVTRMQALGATPDELAHGFDYRMFPKFAGGLDATLVAAAELMTIVEDTNPDVVIFDTVSRFINGKENDSDTWLQFYGRIHAPLKARRTACVRLDHTGKDADRGSRGSSAKSQDVDHVWEMTRTDESTTREGDVETVATQIRLRRTHTRTGLGADVLNITRRGRKGPTGAWLPGGTRHELTDPSTVQRRNQDVQSYVNVLIDSGIPKGLGRDAVKDWARRKGITLPGKSEAVAAVVRSLKRAHQ